jgi:hypothetical protein
MTRKVEGWTAVNPNIRSPVTEDLDALTFPLTNTAGAGAVPAGVAATVTAAEYGDGVFHQTVLTLTALDQLIPNGASEWCGTEVYDFPIGRILVLGVTASLAPTTTTALVTTITTGTTGTVALGTVTDDGTHTTTKADLLPDGNFTSSTTVNVAAAAVGKTLVASAPFDGTSAAKAAFLNTKVATNSADGHLAWAGNITMTWVELGTY